MRKKIHLGVKQVAHAHLHIAYSCTVQFMLDLLLDRLALDRASR